MEVASPPRRVRALRRHGTAPPARPLEGAYRTAYDEGGLLEVRRNTEVPACSQRTGLRAAPPRGVRRDLMAALLVLLALLTLAPRGAAQTFTWTGASNPNWKTNGNWLGGAAPTGNGGENLVFPSGAANLTNNNNLKGTSFNSITISGSGYTVGGNATTLTGSLADSSVAGTNTISLGLTFAATRTVTVSNAATTLTISGVISGAGGLTKSGSGTVTLSAANTYTGVTTINVGTIAIAADAGLGAAPGAPTAGKLTFGGGTLRTTASFTVAANRGIALTGAGTISTDPGTTLTYGGIIAGASPLTKAGTGTLIVSGANTYTGATAISAGTLQLGATNAVPSGSAVTVSGGATFDLRGFSDGIGSLAGGGTVTSSAAGAVTLTGGGNNSSTTFSGVIQNGSGTVALTKTGTGTLTLSGTNTYTGVTTINAGTVAIAADAGLGTAPAVPTPGRLTFGGGTLETTASFTLATNRGIALTGAGTISTDPGTTLTYGGIIAGASPLTKAGTGTLIVSGANTYTGATAISAGTLQLGATNAVPSGRAVTVSGGATFDLRGFSDGIGSLAGAGTVTSGAAGAVTLTAGGNNASTTFSGLIQNGSGTVALTKTGTGTLTLSGANTYSGATTVSAGVLDVQNNTALGATAGATTVAGGAALQLEGSGLVVAEPVTLNGTGIAGGGALRQVAHTNTWSGAIPLGSAARVNADAGTLTVSGGITNGGFLLTVGGAC